MAEYIKRNDVYELFPNSGFARLHVADIDKIPSADVEPVKHGKWLPQIIAGENTWYCSDCKTVGSQQWKRCPVCEAKMDLEENMNGNCGECERRWYCNIDPAVCEKMTKPVPTNGDKIRSMTDDELAEFISAGETDMCKEATLKWLQQPAEVDT